MKKLHILSWDKDTDKELSDTITWDNDYDLKLKTDNYFDQKSATKSKDPRHNRFKSKDTFLRKKNLSVNTKDPNSNNLMESNLNSSAGKNGKNVEVMDLDSLSKRLHMEDYIWKKQEKKL